MSESLEHGLARLEVELRRVAGLPGIAGGSIASAEFLLSRIVDIVEGWNGGGGSVPDPLDIGEIDVSTGIEMEPPDGSVPDADTGKSAYQNFNAKNQDQTETWAMYAQMLADSGPGSYLFIGSDHGGGMYITTDGDVIPIADDSGSLGNAAQRWGNLFLDVPTTDPGVTGQIWSDNGVLVLSGHSAGDVALKQSTAYVKEFIMVDSSDHVTGKTGLTPTVKLSKAGGALADAGGTVAEIGSGLYKISLTTTDTNTVGDLGFHCTSAGADPTDFIEKVKP